MSASEDIAAVRLATVADADLVGRLLHDFNREFDEPTPGAARLAERVRQLLADGEITVLVVGSEPGGVAILHFRPSLSTAASECYVSELYVVPARRRRGLGRGLLDAAVELARDRGAEQMDLADVGGQPRRPEPLRERGLQQPRHEPTVVQAVCPGPRAQSERDSRDRPRRNRGDRRYHPRATGRPLEGRASSCRRPARLEFASRARSAGKPHTAVTAQPERSQTSGGTKTAPGPEPRQACASADGLWLLTIAGALRTRSSFSRA
jgi:GNAT superfamily N-acetyltransferase